VAVICNPAAGRGVGRDWGVLLDVLRLARVSVQVLETTAPGDATTLARQVAEERPDAVAVAGGDGTLNEVVNGLAYTGIPVAILPLGTANVFAREIGLPCSGRAAADAVLYGARQTVHLGKAGERFFVLMAGIGFDGEVVASVSPRVKSRLGKLAYVLAALRVAWRNPGGSLRVVADGEELAGAHAVLSNARFYGGAFRVTPDARLDDPDLHLCVFGRRTRASLLRYAIGVALNRHVAFDDVHLRRVRQVTVESPQTTYIQLDGDPGGTLPMTFTVAEDALTVILPWPARRAPRTAAASPRDAAAGSLDRR
jgi:YegS/Rv2252/BmrU family lipid kinase